MSDTKLQPIVESYNVNEEYLYSKTYLFIKGYASGRNFKYTLKALPLARQLHNNQYRKGVVEVDGKLVRLPYLFHCLKVCCTLMALNIPMTNEELDILYTCAILHDTLEDASEYFPKGGIEYSEVYGFPKQIGEIIKLLSKHQGATEAELNFYFNNIKVNKFALLIKLADRSHNVEDLYNMKNIPKYISETRTYFISKNSICTYGKQNFPELSNAITILKAKLLSLTETTETILERQKEILEQKDKEIEKLKGEIRRLKSKEKGEE